MLEPVHTLLLNAGFKKRKGEIERSFHSFCHVEACHLEYSMDAFPEQSLQIKHSLTHAWKPEILKLESWF